MIQPKISYFHKDYDDLLVREKCLICGTTYAWPRRPLFILPVCRMCKGGLFEVVGFRYVGDHDFEPYSVVNVVGSVGTIKKYEFGVAPVAVRWGRVPSGPVEFVCYEKGFLRGIGSEGDD